MIFDDLLKDLDTKQCKEMREREVDYLEMVVERSRLQAVLDTLTTYFGAPLKPEGKAPCRAAKHYSAPYGGIYQGQTMYFREGDAGPELALLWPWGSEALVTVKIIRGEINPLPRGI